MVADSRRCQCPCHPPAVIASVTFTDEELAAIEQRANAALPGPWRLFDQYEPDNAARENVVLWDDPQLAEGIDGWVCLVPGDPADAEFIAHARSDVHRLIAALSASRSSVAVLSTANVEFIVALRAKDEELQRVRRCAEWARWHIDYEWPSGPTGSREDWERFLSIVGKPEEGPPPTLT